MNRNADRLSSGDKKEILGRIDNVDIVLSNGETPETNQAARIRKAARDVLRESLKHVNSRAEAEQLLERTIATMKSFDASLVQLDSQTDSASLRAKIERDALSRGVSGAAVESAEQSSVAQVKKVRTKDGSEVYIVVGGSDSTEKKNVAVAFSRANGNVWVQVAASMGTYYVNGSGERVSLNEIDNGTNIDQPNFTVSPKDAVATSAMPSPSAASSSSSAKSRRSSDSSGTSTHSGPEVSSEGLPSIGRVNLGSDYSGSSYEKSIPVFANRKIVSMDAIKGVKTTVLGQDVLLRNQSGRRAGSLDRGNTVTLTGKIIYMRAIDRATGATVVLPYLDIGNDQYIAAKFVKTASVAATTTTVRPSPTLPGTPGGGSLTPSPTLPGTPGGGSLTPSPTLPGTPGAGGSLTPSPTLPGTPGAGGSLTPSPTLPGTPGAGSPVLSASPVARPAEWRTFVGDMHDLSRRWTYVNDVQSDRNIVDFDAEDLSEAWNTNEVRAVLTSDGVRLMRDEKNHHLIAFADLNKSQFERFAPASLQQKVNDMELILKAAVAYDSAESGGTSRTPKNLYEDFRVALEGYAPGKESVLESVMSNAAIALDERLGGIMTTIKDFLSSGTAHSVKDILAQSDPNARKRMSHEWARYFSHAVTSQTILNDRFDDVTELVGSKMTDADLTAIQAMLGDYGSSAVDNFVGGIRNPSVIADPQQRAACERIAQIFQKYPANERDKAIGIFTKNIYDKIVGLSSEATKYLEVHKQDHHEAIRTKVNEVYGIDINRIPADRSTLNDRERQAAQAWDAAERATAANVKAVFALTAVKSGIFDAAVGLAVQNDSIKRFPDAEMYASIEGKLGDWNISDSTWDMGVSTLAFILPEIIGMAVGMGVGYAAIRLGSGILRGTSGLRAARAAAQGGRLGNMVRLGAEGAVYGYTTYEFGRGIPNVLNGRPWYEGFDSRELAFNVLLGGLYPGVHAITNKFSPFNRILLGQGLGSKTIRFAGNTMIDTGIVMAGGYTVDLMFGAGDWAENDFFQVLAMMPLMRIGMNLSAGSRYRFLVEKGSDGNPAMRVLDPKSALVSDEIVSSLKSLNDAPVGLEIRFPGSTVVKLPNDQFRVTPAGGGGHYDVSVGNFFNPKRWSGLLAEVRRHIPANTTLSGADLAMMSESRMAAKLARELPDSVVLARGYHLKIDNPTAAAADWRYTVKDSSDRVIVSSVDRAALERFATDARGHGASIMTQLRSGAPEIHDGPIRAVVTNPDQLDETLRLCDVYHNNVKIASGIPIAEVDVRLNRVFARLDDALVTNLDDLVGRAATSKSEWPLSVHPDPSATHAAPLYEIRQGGGVLTGLSDAHAKRLLNNGIPRKTSVDIRNLLDPATPVPAASSPAGIAVHGDIAVRYDPTLPLTPPAGGGPVRTYTIVYRDPAAGPTDLVVNLTHDQMGAVLNGGINKPAASTVDDFMSAVRHSTTDQPSVSIVRGSPAGNIAVEAIDPTIMPPANRKFRVKIDGDVYAEGISFAEVAPLLRAGSHRPSMGITALLNPLRAPTLAQNHVTLGNLTVSVENIGAPMASRTYRIECNGQEFGRGIDSLAKVEEILNGAANLRSLDDKLAELAPTRGGVPIERKVTIDGQVVRRLPDGTYSMKTRNGVQSAMTREQVVSELAIRHRASTMLFGVDSPFVSSSVSRIIQRLDRESSVELVFSGHTVKLERLADKKIKISGGPAGTPDSAPLSTFNQSEIRKEIARRAGLEANGQKFLEENAPAIFERAFRNISTRSVADVVGPAGTESILSKIKNGKSAEVVKNFLIGNKIGDSIPFANLVRTPTESVPGNGNKIKTFIYTVLAGGLKTESVGGLIVKAPLMYFASGITTNLGDAVWERIKGDADQSGADSFGEHYIGMLALGLSHNVIAKIIATLVVTADWSKFDGTTPNDLMNFLGSYIDQGGERLVQEALTLIGHI